MDHLPDRGKFWPEELEWYFAVSLTEFDSPFSKVEQDSRI